MPLATRNSYEAAKRPIRVEQGTVDNPTETAWAAFTTYRIVDKSYDIQDIKTRERVSGGGTAFAIAC